MAIFAVILGGLFGFCNFIAALVLFETGFFTALGIYSASGLLLTICIIALTCIAEALTVQLPILLRRNQTSSERF